MPSARKITVDADTLARVLNVDNSEIPKLVTLGMPTVNGRFVPASCILWYVRHLQGQMAVRDETPPLAGNRLTRDQKVFITTRLACMDAPSTVRDEFRSEFGIEIAISTIVWYDPTIGRSKPLGKEWAELFHETRAAFLADVSRVPIMHKVHRARQYQRILEMELEDRNLQGARDTLEMAAKEEGGVFTNRREITGRDGKDLMPPAEPHDLSKLSFAQLKELEALMVIATVTVAPVSTIEPPDVLALPPGENHGRQDDSTDSED